MYQMVGPDKRCHELSCRRFIYGLNVIYVSVVKTLANEVVLLTVI